MGITYNSIDGSRAQKLLLYSILRLRELQVEVGDLHNQLADMSDNGILQHEPEYQRVFRILDEKVMQLRQYKELAIDGLLEPELLTDTQRELFTVAARLPSY